MQANLLVEKLYNEHCLPKEELRLLLTAAFSDKKLRAQLALKAQLVTRAVFGNKIYIRGLIEFTNYCRNDCYYCGIRRSNDEVIRYRLSASQILSCCEQGYALGFRTFVLQGGEDLSFSDEAMGNIVNTIKDTYPDCAVTLSVGERNYATYKLWKEAGADRYLLRHETATDSHYSRLHPSELNLANRKRCLYDLKELGYQVGAGFMVGSPFQTLENLINDLIFIYEFKPQMIGIGPFLPHHATPFKDYPAGSLTQTLTLLSVLRLMLPNVLLPSTTALGTIVDDGREQGILAGANVVMPNLSPVDVRKNYLLYDNKLYSGAEAAEAKLNLSERLQSIGYKISDDRGDYKES